MKKFEKFEIKRFKKDGTELEPVKIKYGVWIEPHSDEEYNKNIEQNKINKEKGIKERFVYYSGTKIPHIYYMDIKKKDLYGYLAGGPSPWTDPSTIEINEELLKVENLYDKLEEAKKNKDEKMIEFLTRPLVSFRCPQHGCRKNLYAQAVIVSNRNERSGDVLNNISRYENAVKELETIFDKEYINSIDGISALQNLLSSKFCFRVGNTESLKSGTGVTTFRPEHITVDEKGRMHFKFIGKKGVKWHKIFIPKTDIEKKMFDGLIELKNKKNEFLFWINNERVHSGYANEMFKKVMHITDEDGNLSFHTWRHFAASQLFKEELMDKKFRKSIEKEVKKIEEKYSDNRNLRVARLLNKEINNVFKNVAPILNDTPGVVKSTYSGGKIFNEFYKEYGIEVDEKKRTWDKESYSKDLEAEKLLREKRKQERLEKKKLKMEEGNDSI